MAFGTSIWHRLAVRRALPLLVVVGSAGSAARADVAARASDPAFLGIAMPQSSAGGCPVLEVTPETPAAAAGLRAGDTIVALDKQPVASCDELTTIITAHASGDALAIQLLGGRALTATLSTRSDVMRKQIVGRPLAVEVAGVDAKNHYFPMALDHRAIVGWFAPGCAECTAVFAKVERWSRAHGKLPVYAATFEAGFLAPTRDHSAEELAVSDAKPFADKYALGVPLLRTDAPTGTAVATKMPIVFDLQRVVFTVLGDSGDVTAVITVAPESDDADASLEELFVAATSRPHAAPSRR